jgi:hypothetical protein
MPDPVFDSHTERFNLPLLFAGQAEKEGFVNEALVRIDALLHGAIESEQAAPPATPLDGQCWLVATGASGAWAGKSGQIAARQGGQWLFFAPVDGLRLLNRGTNRDMRFAGSWKVSTRPSIPSGGTVVDAEARTAISAIVTCLENSGIVPPA